MVAHMRLYNPAYEAAREIIKGIKDKRFIRLHTSCGITGGAPEFINQVARVYRFDDIPDKVKEEHLNNVEYIWGDIEKIGGTKLKDSILDAVVVSNVLFQIEDKNKFLEEIKRILKPGGRVFLIDWSDSSFVVSPNISKIISENNAREMFEDKGFIWERSIDAGKHHYGIIFTKP